jgi:uncharacterized protein (DUF2336 family)
LHYAGFYFLAITKTSGGLLRRRSGCQVTSTNLISDLERALTTRSAEAGAMLHQLTELFLANVGHYSADQLDLYDGVLNELVKKVEVAARMKLALRLASIDGAPTQTIRSLALDDAIEVAEPVLSQSNALDDDTLSRCISLKGQEYLLAIATRDKISETISGQLIERGNRRVLGTLAGNPGASISDPSFGILVKKSADDDWLLECIAGRKDVPQHHLRKLLSKASEIVRQRLMAAHPELRGPIQEMFPSPATASADKASQSIDYQAAERIVASQEITEELVQKFARENRVGEIVVSIAQLSNLSVDEIGSLLMATWTSPVAVILKAIGFHLPTLELIYRSRLSQGEQVRADLLRTKAEFIAIRRPTAERIVRYFYAKRAVKISNVMMHSPTHHLN